MKRFLAFVLIVVILFGACAQRRAQTDVVPEEPIALKAEIPFHPKVWKGQLENGLQYFIRNNAKPKNRIELRLVVNAGSILEDEDQKGLAHFTEHMAFNGTKHFEKHELVNYLESIGMRFGADLNAYTSFDETVYMLQLPTDDSLALEKGFQILSDWAHYLQFDSLEIEKERGVIKEEWRLGRGAGARLRDQQLPVLFRDSRYADRLPIGDMAIVDSCDHAVLKRFYHDWYRPDLMAVVAVGDIEQQKTMDLIRRYFAPLQNPEPSRLRRLYTVPDHKETLFAIATDREATDTRISIYFKHDPQVAKTSADYRGMIVENLYTSILNQRLREISKQKDPPFLFGYSGKGRFIRSKEFFVLAAGVKDEGVQRGLEAILTEAERIRQHGVTATELDRTKNMMLRMMERANLERDKAESAPYAEEYIRHFLYNEPCPGIAYEYRLYQQYLPGISLDEVNQMADVWMPEENRVVMLSAPRKAGLTVPDETELAAIMSAISQQSVDAYEETVSDAPLVSEPPAPGKIVQRTHNEQLSTDELVFGNGVRVVLKPTDFKNDEILLTSYSVGGHSLVESDQYIAAVTTIPIVRESGLGAFSKTELEKKLADKVVSVKPVIRELYEGIRASASPRDLETMLQLVYLYFTDARLDSNAYLTHMERMRASLQNRALSPTMAFQDTFRVTLAQYHDRARPWSTELLDEMDLVKSEAFYRDRFADAGDFRFFLVGNFETNAILPLLETYLGALPSIGREESWRDVGIDPPQGIIRKSVYRGVEPKSLVQYAFTGPFEYTQEERSRLSAAVEILKIRLREKVREDQGGSYGVRVSASTRQYPQEEIVLEIGFGCDPQRVGELDDIILQEIERLQSDGPQAEELQKVRETFRRKRETNLKKNSFWLQSLFFYSLHGEAPESIFSIEQTMAEMQPEDVQSAARKYFHMDNYVQVVLYPQEMQKK